MCSPPFSLQGLVLALALLLSSATASAVTLQRGDVVVVDRAARALLLVDPLTGMQTVISQGGSFVEPMGIAISPDGAVYVFDFGADSLFRVDPATGSQTYITRLPNSYGMQFDAAGDLIVADGSLRQVLSLDPTSGDRTILSSDHLLMLPRGIALDALGNLLVADVNAGAVFRVNLATGHQSILTSGNGLLDPFDVAVDADGNVFVVDAVGGGTVYRVDPTSGSRTVVSTVPENPLGIAVDPWGDLWVTDRGTSTLFRIDPSSGVATAVSTGGSFQSLWGVAVFVPEPETALLLAASLGAMTPRLRRRRQRRAAAAEARSA